MAGRVLQDSDQRLARRHIRCERTCAACTHVDDFRKGRHWDVAYAGSHIHTCKHGQCQPEQYILTLTTSPKASSSCTCSCATASRTHEVLQSLNSVLWKTKLYRMPIGRLLSRKHDHQPSHCKVAQHKLTFKTSPKTSSSCARSSATASRTHELQQSLRNVLWNQTCIG